MKCYECNSDTENEHACITDSQLEPFGVECKPGSGFTSAATGKPMNTTKLLIMMDFAVLSGLQSNLIQRI